MARGLFITGFTISEVLAIQQRAKGFLIKGKTLFHKTCPNFTPVLPRLNLEEITPFTTPNPFIYVDSACLRSRHEYPNLSSKLIVCLAVYWRKLSFEASTQFFDLAIVFQPSALKSSPRLMSLFCSELEDACLSASAFTLSC